MTRIQKISLKGFKSFANRSDLILGDNFNVVIGPNGSGKSNIMDAICFVLGKAGSKGLRAEKSSNLIYNGGKTKNPAKEGEVSIYFDNKDNLFPTPGDSVKVSRVIKQSGQSVYKINDKKRTREQILDLLAVAKIDPEGHNIVLQGDIVTFIEMSPMQRRLLVEEVAGISVYEEKKEKAVRELDKVESKLKEADIILTERSAHLKELKKDRNHALKYRELEDKIKQNKASYLKIQIDRKDEEKKKYDSTIEKDQKNLKSLFDEVKKIKEAIQNKKGEVEKINSEIEQKGDVEQNKIQQEVEQLKVGLATNSSRVSSCSNEIEKIKQRKEQLKVSLEEIGAKINEIGERKKELQAEKTQKEKEGKDIEKKIAEFKKKNKLDDSESIDSQITEIDKTGDEKQKEILGLREEQQNLLREKDKIEFQIKAIDDAMDKVLEVEKEHKAEIEALKKKREEFKKTTLELNKQLNEDSSLAAQLGTARSRLLKRQQELSSLKARNLTIAESLSGDSAVRFVLGMKNQMKGIFGTVSDIGEVSSKYALALEVAAGPKLRSVVVESDKTASDCIKYLKDKRLGVVTFIPLNKIKAGDVRPGIKDLASASGVHGVAIDLISYDNQFKTVFSHVFGNTLVVENLETARKIGIGKAKMVTLEGDLAEVSGVMQGGFRQKRPSGFGFQETEVNAGIKEKEELISKDEIVISSIEKKRAEIEEKITELRLLKANLEGEIIKGEKGLHLESADLDASRKRKKDLKDELVKIEKSLRETENNIANCNSELARIKIEKQKLRTRISELRNPVLLAELNTFEQKKQELSESGIKIDSELKTTEIQHKSMLLPEKEKTEKILGQHDREHKEFDTEIKELNAKIKNQGSMLKEKEKIQKAFYEQYKELFNKKNKVSEEISKKESALASQEEDSRKVEQRINNASLEVARIKGELAGLEEDFKQYEGIKTFKKDEQEIKREINAFERMVENMGSVNIKALEIYDSVEKEYKSLFKKKDQLQKEREDVLVMMNEIESKKADLFMKTYDALNGNFSRIFDALSTKGNASLELENKDMPLEGGLNIRVKLSGKKSLDIRALSGGEKTLTALAFIFAIQEHDPASFYILDEVDAALDKRNSEKFSKLIKKYSRNAQYLIISHNDGVITDADLLYGVSMNEHGMSKVLSLKV